MSGIQSGEGGEKKERRGRDRERARRGRERDSPSPIPPQPMNQERQRERLTFTNFPTADGTGPTTEWLYIGSLIYKSTIKVFAVSLLGALGRLYDVALVHRRRSDWLVLSEGEA